MQHSGALSAQQHINRLATGSKEKLTAGGTGNSQQHHAAIFRGGLF
jgi:hypothetical protein